MTGTQMTTGIRKTTPKFSEPVNPEKVCLNCRHCFAEPNFGVTMCKQECGFLRRFTLPFNDACNKFEPRTDQSQCQNKNADDTVVNAGTSDATPHTTTNPGNTMG